MSNPEHTIYDEIDVETLRPTGDYVLIRLFSRERTSGGILLPKNKATEAVFGEVVSCGPGIQNSLNARQVFPTELSRGDCVLIMDYSGERIELRDGQYRMYHSRWIPARVTFKDRASYDLAGVAPRMDYLLIDPDEETKTRGGLVLVDGLKENKYRLGTVVSVGPGVWHSPTGKRIPLGVAAGDRVLFERWQGAEVVVSGRTMRLVMEQDLGCAVKGL